VKVKKIFARFKAFTAVKIQVKFLWIMTPCSVVEEYQHFGGFFCHLHPEDGGSKVFRKFGILNTARHRVTIQKTSTRKKFLSHFKLTRIVA